MSQLESTLHSINPFGLNYEGAPIPTISKITENIWIGNIYDAINHELLQSHDIDAVLNVMGPITQLNLNNVLGVAPSVVHPNMYYSQFPLMQPFGETKSLAMNAVTRLGEWVNIGLKVMVHCWSGKDRAPTIVWRYISEYNNDDSTQKLIEEARPIVKIHRDWWD